MTKKFLVSLVVAVAVAGFVPSPVSAHAKLVSSYPGPSTTLNTGPAEIILFFDEDVDVELGRIELFNSAKSKIDIGDPYLDATDGKIVRAKVPEIGADTYVVYWRVTSDDGHPIEGAFSFSVGGGTPAEQDQLLTAIVSGEGGSASLKWVIGGGRFLAFLGICALLGVFVITQGGALMRLQRVQTLWLAGLMVLLVGSLIVMLLYGPYAIRGDWGDVVDVAVLRDTLSVKQGQALAVRVALAVALVVFGIVRSWRERVGAVWQNVAALSLVGILVTFSISGHPSTITPAVLGVTLDALHLGTIGAWLGGLIVLVVAGRALATESGDDFAVVSQFSKIAVVVLPIGVITGIILGWQIIDDVSLIGHNQYTRLLVAKFLMVVVLLVVSLLARRALKAADRVSLRRMVLGEFAIGVVLLTVTSGLVASSPNEKTSCSRPSTDVTVSQSNTLASISVSNPCVGNTFIHVTVSPPNGSLTKLADATGQMEPVDGSGSVVNLDMIASGINHWTATTSFPSPGEWKLQFVVDVGDGTQLNFVTNVTVVGD